MEQTFRKLSEFALDPFARLAAANNPKGALIDAGLDSNELELALSQTLQDPEAVANGGFSSCETCIDPGDDPDRFP